MNQITLFVACFLLVSSSSLTVRAESPVKPEENVVLGEQPMVAVAPQSPAVPVPVVEKPEAVQEQPQAYAPASLVPAGQQDSVKPVSVMNNKEQYGQPESASIPANYKPFGSWGLYIGGNPADGYYTNYYKSLDGQSAVQGGQQQPSMGVSGQPMVSPQSIYKQSISPFQQSGYQSYPYFYSPSELQSGAPINHYSQGMGVMPPMVPPMDGLNYYSPEHYALGSGLKRVGSPVQQVRELSKTSSQPKTSGVKGFHHQQQQQQQQHQVKGYSPVSPLYGPAMVSQHQQHQQVMQSQQPQVVAYSVPVGSQIVGYQSEPGLRQHQVQGQAYNGIHAFTRYAVKPVVGAGEPSSYYEPMPYFAAPSGEQVYKQQQQQQFQYQSPAGYQPFAFYGYPLNQAAPVMVSESPVAPVAPVAGPVVEPVAVAAPAPALAPSPIEAPMVPVSPAQVTRAQAVAAPSSPLLALQEQVSQQVEQVVEQKEAVKGAVKGH